MTFDILEEMTRMRKEIDRILGEGGRSSWTFPFSEVTQRSDFDKPECPLYLKTNSKYLQEMGRS
jgi:hypothetical protein